MSNKKQENLLDNVEKLLSLRSYLNHDFRLHLGNIASSLELEGVKDCQDIYLLLEKLSEKLDNPVEIESVWVFGKTQHEIDADLVRYISDENELEKKLLDYRPNKVIFDMNDVSEKFLDKIYLQYNGIVSIETIGGSFKDCKKYQS